jgi:hypothetical protein
MVFNIYLANWLNILNALEKHWVFQLGQFYEFTYIQCNDTRGLSKFLSQAAAASVEQRKKELSLFLCNAEKWRRFV